MIRLRYHLCWLVIGTAVIASCGKEEQPQENIRPVRYIQVFSTGGSRIRTFSGVAQAGQESRLSFRVPGTIRRIAVGVGDEVAAGSLIAELDASDYNLRVQQAEAALDNAEAQARRAQADYDRVRGLYENNNASKSDLDAARAANESAYAARQSAEKQLELARLQLSYARLRAPTSGAIASVDVEVNENVQAGRQVVLLTAGSDIEVQVSMPELLISEIVEGSEVEVTFDAIPDRKYPARVTEVGVASTAVATTFPVTVRLTMSDKNIRSGMASQVAFRFESRDQRERFLVPSVAVGEDRQGRFVYIVEPVSDQPGYGIVHRRAATVGELTAEGLEIFEGLADGEYVVTAGVSSLEEGQQVRM